MCMIVQQ